MLELDPVGEALDRRSYPVKEVPITRPRPKVIPAASNPKTTCLVPEEKTFRPVSKAIPEPMPNRATVAQQMLTITPTSPDKKKNGATGMMAPSVNKQNEAPAA